MDTCALNDFYSPAQRARFLASIPKRQSVRKFSAAPDVAQKSALNYAASRVKKLPKNLFMIILKILWV